MSNDIINIIIISQQFLFRQGVELTLSSTEDMNVIGSADFSNGIEFSIVDLTPDVAILDVDGSSETGFNWLAR